MHYQIVHKTEFSYAHRVSYCHNEAFLTPRETSDQRFISASLVIDPTPSWQFDRVDYFGNQAHYFEIQTPHTALSVTANSEIITTDQTPLPDSPAWEQIRDELSNPTENRDAREFIHESTMLPEPAPGIKDYAARSFTPGRPLLEAAAHLNQRIFEEFEYDPQFSTVVTPLAKVFKHRRGVCQDFAHFFIACIRSHGLSGRYVSGYLETFPPPGQEKLIGSDASHAWASVYLPSGSWFDFDPTNNQRPGLHHITTAWGRDYSDVAPLKGVIFGGGEHSVKVGVDVRRVETTEGPL